jgi:hypothetical protein
LPHRGKVEPAGQLGGCERLLTDRAAPLWTEPLDQLPDTPRLAGGEQRLAELRCEQLLGGNELGGYTREAFDARAFLSQGEHQEIQCQRGRLTQGLDERLQVFRLFGEQQQQPCSVGHATTLAHQLVRAQSQLACCFGPRLGGVPCEARGLPGLQGPREACGGLDLREYGHQPLFKGSNILRRHPLGNGVEGLQDAPAKLADEEAQAGILDAIGGLLREL